MNAKLYTIALGKLLLGSSLRKRRDKCQLKFLFKCANVI